MNRQGIEGIADHLKVVGMRAAKEGEYFIADSVLERWISGRSSYSVYPILEPDNVYNVYDLTDVKIPEGYEFAEYRVVKAGDRVITRAGDLDIVAFGFIHTFGPDFRRIIVKPSKKTRRVLVVEQDIPEDLKIDSVMAINDDICAPDVHLNYFIETREVKN